MESTQADFTKASSQSKHITLIERQQIERWLKEKVPVAKLPADLTDINRPFTGKYNVALLLTLIQIYLKVAFINGMLLNVITRRIKAVVAAILGFIKLIRSYLG